MSEDATWRATCRWVGDILKLVGDSDVASRPRRNQLAEAITSQLASAPTASQDGAVGPDAIEGLVTATRLWCEQLVRLLVAQHEVDFALLSKRGIGLDLALGRGIGTPALLTSIRLLATLNLQDPARNALQVAIAALDETITSRAQLASIASVLSDYPHLNLALSDDQRARIDRHLAKVPNVEVRRWLSDQFQEGPY